MLAFPLIFDMKRHYFLHNFVIQNSFWQPLLKLYKHIVLHLILYAQNGGLTAWVCLASGLMRPEEQL